VSRRGACVGERCSGIRVLSWGGLKNQSFCFCFLLLLLLLLLLLNLILLNKYYCCCPWTTSGRSRLDAVLILHKNRALASVPAIASKRGCCCCNPLSYGVSQSESCFFSCLKSTFSDEAMGVSTRHFLLILALKLGNRAPVEAPCVFSRVLFSMTTSKSCSRCGAVHILVSQLALITAH
jgi:hypothetical protein